MVSRPLVNPTLVSVVSRVMNAPEVTVASQDISMYFVFSGKGAEHGRMVAMWDDARTVPAVVAVPGAGLMNAPEVNPKPGVKIVGPALIAFAVTVKLIVPPP